MLQFHKNKQKVLNLFCDFPQRRFQLREISRLSKISSTSVKIYLEEFVKKKFILKINEGVYPFFISNYNNDNFKFDKKINLLCRLQDSRLLDFLNNECVANSIFLFGSAAKGEDLEESDIDIFVEANVVKVIFVCMLLSFVGSCVLLFMS